MSDEELVKALKLLAFVHNDGAITQAADRIDELQVGLQAVLNREAATTARYDAKTDELEAKLAKATEALRAVAQHEASIFFGLDAEKSRRASWRGVTRKVKAALAEIEGENT